MTREELILDCRYYNGEDDPPQGVDSLFWGYEQVWVKWMLEGGTNVENKVKYYTERHRLPQLLPDDGTPLGLKAILFGRYEYWSGGRDAADVLERGFKQWYLDKYVAHTRTHRQLLNGQ